MTTLYGAAHAEKMKRDGNTEVTERRTQRAQSSQRFAEKSGEEEPKSTDPSRIRVNRSVCATKKAGKACRGGGMAVGCRHARQIVVGGQRESATPSLGRHRPKLMARG
jgi:hypothetical protein